MTITDRPSPKNSSLFTSLTAPTCLSPLVHLSVFGLVLAITAFPLRGNAQTGWINELHYDNDGPDSGEFVEIVIANADRHDIDDFSLYLLNGSDGSIYASAAGSAFVEGETEGLFTLYTWEPSSLHNGNDGVALVHRGKLLHFISYEGPFVGSESPVLDQPSTDVGVEELPTTLQNRSLQLRGNGGDGGAFTWTGPETASPGTVNANQFLLALPLRVVPGPASVVPGDTIRLDFLLGSSEHPASDIIGAGFQLAIDTTLFTLLDFTTANFFSADTLTFRRIKPVEGTVAYGVTTTDTSAAFSGADTLAALRLRVEEIPTADTTLTFSPFDMNATRKSGTTLVLAPIQQALTITSIPTLTLSSTLVDFGVVDITSTAVDSFTVANTGGAPLTVTGITDQNPDVTIEPSTFTLTAGDSQRVTVSFRPSGGSALSDTLWISSNDPNNPLVNIVVEGRSGALVWPGDTDNNGLVNAFDVLPVGQHFGRTGPERTDKSLSWTGVSVTPWAPVAASYADATGDGLVSQNDIQPIGLNYGRQRTSGKSAAPALNQVLSIEQLPEGSVFEVRIEVPSDRPIADMLGIGVGLSYPPDLMEIMHIEHYLGGAEKDLLAFKHTDKEAGILEAAYTRKRSAGGTVGSGPIVSISFRATASIRSGTVITLERAAASSPRVLDVSPHLEIQSDAAAAESYPTAFALHGSYPNPFNSSTTVVLDLPAEAAVDITVYDVLGRTVLRMPGRQLRPGYGRRIVLSAPRLTSGTYFYRVNAVTSDATYSEVSTFTLLK